MKPHIIYHLDKNFCYCKTCYKNLKIKIPVVIYIRSQKDQEIVNIKDEESFTEYLRKLYKGIKGKENKPETWYTCLLHDDKENEIWMGKNYKDFINFYKQPLLYLYNFYNSSIINCNEELLKEFENWLKIRTFLGLFLNKYLKENLGKTVKDFVEYIEKNKEEFKNEELNENILSFFLNALREVNEYIDFLNFRQVNFPVFFKDDKFIKGIQLNPDDFTYDLIPEIKKFSFIDCKFYENIEFDNRLKIWELSDLTFSECKFFKNLNIQSFATDSLGDYYDTYVYEFYNIYINSCKFYDIVEININLLGWALSGLESIGTYPNIRECTFFNDFYLQWLDPDEYPFLTYAWKDEIEEDVHDYFFIQLNELTNEFFIEKTKFLGNAYFNLVIFRNIFKEVTFEDHVFFEYVYMKLEELMKLLSNVKYDDKPLLLKHVEVL